MTNPDDNFSEDALVEQPAIELLKEMRWEHLNCYHETFGPDGTLGRETTQEVVLTRRLLPAIRRLNPRLPAEAVKLAVEELLRDRSAMTPAAANREVYALLKNGVKVTFNDPRHGGQTVERVKVIDWDTPSSNDFFLASQFWVSGQVYKRRADLVGFVNGLPLVFIELKASHRQLEDAFRNNLRDYKATIPQVFWYNAFIILSNGSQSRIGSITADWEHFAEWKKINSEGERGIVSLETMLRGTCERERFLDLVENFMLFHETKGGLLKLVAKNHQYLGVNNSIRAVQQIRRNQGRLGVFWHTQGSGKSFSMVFFAQKVLRKVPGNWTFVVVTDRLDLDNQIYKNFANVGAVTEAEERVRAESGEHLKRLLREDHRYVFTLIQKFGSPRGEAFPRLSDRDDVIVMTDEAHRSQYDTLAMNMRTALPKAAFLAFTGTPLIKGEEEKTRKVFGDYVSIYDFKQSVDDQATVPLYYENRIPGLQLRNKDLNADMERVLEEAELDPEQEKKLEREFGREYHLITHDERLDRIASDVVAHFVGRGYLGKGMFIAIDKATAVRVHDKVRKAWAARLASLRTQFARARAGERDALASQIRFMEETDMAVVVSQSQNEVADFQAMGLDITPHRLRMVREDLETKFKDPESQLRLVFICAMWITGFDVPCCSTIYLDKPMRNHTLMQTIARANRVFGQKVNGLIVDYVGVFRDLQKALAIYGAAGGGAGSPVEDKKDLIRRLREAVAETTEFLGERKVEAAGILAAAGLSRVKLLDEAVEAVLVNDESKRKYLSLAAYVRRLYLAILPDVRAGEFAPVVTLLGVIAEKIRSLMPPVDISDVMKSVSDLLDRSIATDGYIIRAAKEEPQYLDLSKIDFDALRKHFVKSRKRMEIERLRSSIEAKLARMVGLNKSRLDFQEKFERLIDEYNAGSRNAEEIYEELLEFVKQLNVEERRHIVEQLTEEELALFDILMKPRLEMTRKEELEVKKVATEMLQKLKDEMIVLDWRQRQQSRAAVRLCIEETLDRLPGAFTPDIYNAKCESIYQHVFDSYYGPGQSVYAIAV
jgi:type I restriction enzyme R subunit